MAQGSGHELARSEGAIELASHFGAVRSASLDDTKKAAGWPEGQPTAEGVAPDFAGVLVGRLAQ